MRRRKFKLMMLLGAVKVRNRGSLLAVFPIHSKERGARGDSGAWEGTSAQDILGELIRASMLE